jgi:S-adenosylmethionine:tRNA ribosyltransferase-isomerase
MLISDFDYDLPEHAIAQSAVEPRDSSRLLRVRGREDHRFAELPDVLEAGDLLVVNRTRVRAARLRGHKVGSGGAVEALLLRRLDTVHWQVMVRPARRLRAGVQLRFGCLSGVIESDPIDGISVLALTSADGDVEELLPQVGEVPLPPYFHGSLPTADRYQTLFAKTVGSAAAPTAALHFTPRLCAELGSQGITFAEIDLEVGLDTFRPMQGDRIEDHVIHRERFEVPEAAADQIRRTRGHGGRVVAVGTTSIRALETMASGKGMVDAGSGESELFIAPGYEARVVDAVITNFHAPRTTLIALVAAFIGAEWRSVYETAVARGYRFLSFGDAMFIEGIRP